MNVKILVLILTIFIANSLKGQVIEPDSISITKTWVDKNGENILLLKVNALCNPEKPPYDGHPTMIEASLKNKKHQTSLMYDLSFDEYQMRMILFYERNIWFHSMDGVQAVFIPFSYCGNSDMENTLSYIILYNDQKYIFHINYHCDWEDEKGHCKLNDDLQKKLSPITNSKLRKVFQQQLETKYKSVKDIYE